MNTPSELWIRFAESALNGVVASPDPDKATVAANRAAFIADEMLLKYQKRFPEPITKTDPKVIQ